MIPSPRRPGSIAEAAIVAIVVIVLGVAASRTKLEGPDEVDRLASQVRMQSPVAYGCAPGQNPDAARCPARPFEMAQR
jgi:hypothetical protein